MKNKPERHCLSIDCTNCNHDYSMAKHLLNKPIPPNAQRTGDLGRLNYNQIIEHKKSMNNQQPISSNDENGSSKAEGWEKDVWNFLNSECPHEHVDRFNPLFKIINSAISSAVTKREEDMIEIIKKLMPNERKISTYDKWQAKTYDEKMLIISDFKDILANIMILYHQIWKEYEERITLITHK